ncbi:MAG: hypothetical protein WBV94_04090 [Blastocatellia bacterium]
MAVEEHSGGKLGERKVQSFFDANIGNIITFPNAKTKRNAQIADLLVWLNWKVMLVEVKTRVSSKMTLDQWVQERIVAAVEQITNSYSKCISGEEIYIYNDHYHVRFDNAGASFYTGLIVLNFEGKSHVLPSVAMPDIYSRPLPIQVISYDDLEQLGQEINTFPDLGYYLKDRFEYVREHDIPLCIEKNVIGRYKLYENRFPDCYADFESSDLWGEYQKTMNPAIERRDSHNEHSTLIDALEGLFNNQRRLHETLPLGLLFAWEIGAMSRRERAIVGERMDRAKLRFEQGGSRRYFSFQNPSTGNWLVFLFANANADEVSRKTELLTRLKLVKEAHFRDFEFAAYGFGFQVSSTYPIRLLGIKRAVVISSDVVKPYSEQDIQAAITIWGDEQIEKQIKILEFPPANPE